MNIDITAVDIDGRNVLHKIAIEGHKKLFKKVFEVLTQ
jgi:hypothetical protein